MDHRTEEREGEMWEDGRGREGGCEVREEDGREEWDKSNRSGVKRSHR